MTTVHQTTPAPTRSGTAAPDTAAPDTEAPSTSSATTPPMAATAAGRQADGGRRHERVTAVITAAIAAGDPAALAVAAVARTAGVHRSYLYRHPDLVKLLHEAARAPVSGQPAPERVTAASLRADLAHARDRAARAEADARALRRRLSEALGQQVWADTGLGPTDEVAGLRADLERLRQENADLAEALDDRDGELDAARAANRELMAQLNAPPGTGGLVGTRVSSRSSS